MSIDKWVVAELIERLGGSVDRGATVKALGTWIDLGVVKDEGDDMYRLLNTAEEGDQASRGAVRPGMTTFACSFYFILMFHS